MLIPRVGDVALGVRSSYGPRSESGAVAFLGAEFGCVPGLVSADVLVEFFLGVSGVFAGSGAFDVALTVEPVDGFGVDVKVFGCLGFGEPCRVFGHVSSSQDCCPECIRVDMRWPVLIVWCLDLNTRSLGAPL